MTSPEPDLHKTGCPYGHPRIKVLSDARNEVHRRPTVVADELTRRRDGLAEGAGDLVREPDRPRQGERHVALRAGEGPRPEPGGPLRGADLDAGRGSAQALLALRIEIAGWVV